MPLKWLIAMMCVVILLSVVSIILDAKQMEDEGKLSVLDNIMQNHKMSSVSTPFGAVNQVMASGSFFTGMFKVATFDYAYLDGDYWLVKLFFIFIELVFFLVVFSTVMSLIRGVSTG